MSLSGVVVVTGTGTGVGKTVVTAALAAVAAQAGQDVAVVKPVQTGVTGDEPGDVHEVGLLSGVTAIHELARLAPPLAPETAARLTGATLPSVRSHAAVVAGLAERHDLVLVEGAGGLLVRLDGDGGTLADLALGCPVSGVVVVVRAGLGTLNETELTVEALRARGLPVLGLVIGCWPAEPGLAERCNVEDLPRVTGVPFLGRLPEGAGALSAAAFRTMSPGWLTPAADGRARVQAQVADPTS